MKLPRKLESTKEALNATGAAPIYAARAWVNFDGTGTIAIRGSGNISSITDGGVGVYTPVFTTQPPDVNYSWALSTNRTNDNNWYQKLEVNTYSVAGVTTISYGMDYASSTSQTRDFSTVNIEFFW